MSEFNPLVQRVDALLKRHQQPTGAGHAIETGTLDRGRPAPDAGDVQTGPTPPVPETDAVAAPTGDDADIPVLTEIVDAEAKPAALDLDPEALAARIEAAVLEKLLAELDVALDQRLGRTIGDLLEQSLHGLRAELSLGVRKMVREAVAISVTRALEERARNL